MKKPRTANYSFCPISLLMPLFIILFCFVCPVCPAGLDCLQLKTNFGQTQLEWPSMTNNFAVSEAVYAESVPGSTVPDTEAMLRRIKLSNEELVKRTGRTGAILCLVTSLTIGLLEAGADFASPPGVMISAVAGTIAGWGIGHMFAHSFIERTPKTTGGGGMKGAGLGLLSGMICGAIIGFPLPEDQGGDIMLLSAIVGGILGMPIGMISGGILGAGLTRDINSRPEDSIRRSGWPGGSDKRYNLNLLALKF